MPGLGREFPGLCRKIQTSSSTAVNSRVFLLQGRAMETVSEHKMACLDPRLRQWSLCTITASHCWLQRSDRPQGLDLGRHLMPLQGPLGRDGVSHGPMGSLQASRSALVVPKVSSWPGQTLIARRLGHAAYHDDGLGFS